MKKDNEKIRIFGARVHNLQNVDLEIPRNKLTVICGISGSGKSSLAFDTIYAEGQRRYVESLSSYARQFLGTMTKPDVEKIEGLSPAIAIDQKSTSQNPRSTVGTVTEIYDYLRLLFARVGVPHCPNCGKVVSKQSVTQITDSILKRAKEERPPAQINILAPMVRGKKGEHRDVLEAIQKSGYLRVRIDGDMYKTEDIGALLPDKNKAHYIEIVVDRLLGDAMFDRTRVADSVESAFKLSEGSIIIQSLPKDYATSSAAKMHEKFVYDTLVSDRFACPDCVTNIPELEPRLFSFNSPHGACFACTGIGKKLEVDPKLVIPNTKLSIAEGAIKPWSFLSQKIGKQYGYYWSKLSDVADYRGFSLHEPLSSLPKEIVHMLLYGDAESDFEGVVNNLERRWKNTDSDWARSEIEKFMRIKPCPQCEGKRLRPEALAVKVLSHSIYDISSMDIAALHGMFGKLRVNEWDGQFSAHDFKIAEPIIREISGRLQFLMEVGLNYLTLAREAPTLAGGEAQRIRLATQIGSSLVGVTYILDEPSIGLHPRDQSRLIATLKKLRDLGNTVIVVEHDRDTIEQAEYVVDVGPGAGQYGGKIVFAGTPQGLKKSKSLTGKYLSGELKIDADEIRKLIAASDTHHAPQKKQKDRYVAIRGASEHNLKNINVKIPLAKFVCVTGVSGSGKSTLINYVLSRALLKKFYHAKDDPGAHKKIDGIEHLNKVVCVDQSPIGRTPRSNPATYTGAFAYIRALFAMTKEARMRGYKVGRFSFNMKGGRCEACEGQGLTKIEMHFLPDVYVECQECHGTRYNKEVLEILFKGKNIAEVLNMSVGEACKFFEHVSGLREKLKTLDEVGLSYIKLGQPATTLSGGEAQRVKLATELSRKATGNTLYILDEPTTGLHFEDTKKLLYVLMKLVDMGNTVLVIEHNMDVVRCADWVIDMGPEGGDQGGEIVAEGPPATIIKNKNSYTGKFLRKI